MRFLPILAVVPALAAAQEQVPLGDRLAGWLSSVRSFIPTPTAAVPSVEKVAEKKIVEKTVTPVNLTNWKSILEPSTDAQDWLIYVTGGNKTCFGRCDTANKAFNQSVLLFSADPTAPNLGYLDCEQNQILCSIWSAGAPTAWYFKVPAAAQPGEPRPTTPLHVVNLNATTVTPETIYKIHSDKTYQEVPAYEGILHPVDGFLAENSLNIPLGYALYGFGAIPSWLFMIGISFFSRTMMSRRMGNPGGPAPRQT